MRHKQLGSTAIELALVLPLLLLVLDGVIEFSLLMYDKVLITHAQHRPAGSHGVCTGR